MAPTNFAMTNNIVTNGYTRKLNLAAGLEITGATYASSTLHAVGAATAASFSTTNALGLPSYSQWLETNGTFSFQLKAAAQMSRSDLAVRGTLEAASASVIAFNTTNQNRLVITNRLATNPTIVVTNSTYNQEYTIIAMGAVAGGTDYTISLVVNTGHLARNLDGTNNAPATSISIPVPAGSTVEVNGATRFGVGTNWHDVVTRKGLGS